MTNAPTIEALWTHDQAARATGGLAHGAWAASGVSIDSRSCRPGDLFVALRGEAFDGHDFIADAFARGAVAVLAESLPEGRPGLVVADSMAGLSALGAAGRARAAAQVIGVTGSVGKTGAKEALRAALARSAPCHASARSFNNDIGVPLSLARLPRHTPYCVQELGMNHAGELTALSALCRPHVALITTVEAAHSEFFASLEDIADAKAEVFSGLEGPRVAILNRDNWAFDRLAEKARAAGVARIISFGEDPRAEVRLLKYRLHENMSCVSADIGGVILTYKLGVAGRHWVTNSLGVLAAVWAVGGDLGLAGLGLGDMVAGAGRGRHHEVFLPTGRFRVIDESYNASPAAMQAAFDNFARIAPEKRGRRIAVLGEMRELGAASPAAHAALAEPLAAAGADVVLTLGADMAALAEALDGRAAVVRAKDLTELIEAAVHEVRAGDVVLVKGSNALCMSRVVDALVGLEDSAPRRVASA
jgi:UDP-N-acetylmuramoyl-tripeptide--D-alanyl-D-alanine ligase